MSLFSKLSRMIGRADDGDAKAMKELERLNKDGRLHARYLIHGEGVAMLEVDGLAGVVKDVSYGGLACKFELRPEQKTPELAQTVTARLTLLDRTVTCQMSPVRVVRQGDKLLFAGFSVHHESADTLIFMRDLIEPLRCGKSLVSLDPSMRQERYRGAGWSCLRGDGPTDLLLRSEADGRLAEALLTFRIADSYHELSYRDGKLKTGRATGGAGINGASAQMASNGTPDPVVLRQAACIMLGAPPSARKAIMALLVETLRHLSVEFRDAA